MYYGDETLKAVGKYPITGYKIDKALIYGMVNVKKAAAKANLDLELIDEEKGNAIIQACKDIIDNDEMHKWFIVDPIQGGAGLALNINANEVIANRALEILGREKGDFEFLSPEKHVNMSQNQNDVFSVAVHIATMIQLDKYVEALEKLIDVVDEKDKEFADSSPKYSKKFEAYSAVLRRDIDRVYYARTNLCGISISVTEKNSEYIQNVVEYLARFSKKPIYNRDNLIDSTQNTNAYSEASSTLKVCILNISKIANDIRLMASQDEYALKEINKDVCDIVNQVAFQVSGNDITVSISSEAGQFERNVMEPVIAFNLLESLNIIINAINLFRESCIEGISLE